MSEELKSWPERVWLQGGEESIETYPGAHPDLTWCEAKYNAGDIEYVRADLASRAQPERKLTDAMPTLPRSLLDLIGEYGMARTDNIGQLEIQYRWELLIAGIKDYARSVLAAQPAASWSLDLSKCQMVPLQSSIAPAIVSQPAAATVPDEPPATLLTAQQWAELNNVAFMLEHLNEPGMADQVQAICEAADISAQAAQAQDDGVNMHTQSTHQENVSKNEPEIDMSCSDNRRDAGLAYSRTCPICKFGPCQRKDKQ